MRYLMLAAIWWPARLGPDRQSVFATAAYGRSGPGCSISR